MKEQLIASGTTLVVRPDSGHPETVVLDVVRRLDKSFGTTLNSKGYKVLNNVRVIQGDGINENSIRGILMNLEFAGYSADNVAFGMGGALLQIVNRDTQAFAMKCCAIRVNGTWRDVYKDPIGDAGKKSKKGRVTLIRDKDRFQTVLEKEVEAYEHTSKFREVLDTVYLNGELVKEISFAEVRANAA